MSYTNVPVKGGKVVSKALSRIASKRELESGEKVPIGGLVLNALVSTYGAEFREAVSFFAESGELIINIDNLMSKKDSA